MNIDPNLDELVNGKRGILKGIEICLQQECLVSGVALIFCGIDSLAALTRPKDAGDTSRLVFIEWIERFLLPNSGMVCTGLDLYGARCGVLHTHSAESKLKRQGQAKPLIYEWQLGPKADAQVPLPAGAIVIHAERFHNAFKTAVQRFLMATATDKSVKSRVEYHLKMLLCYRPWP